MLSIVVFLVVVSGCSQPQKRVYTGTSDTTGNTISPPAADNGEMPNRSNPCDDLQCGAEQTCRNGQCICLPGRVACGSECLPAGSCCSDSDCDSGHTCSDNTCEEIPECDDRTCEANMVCTTVGYCVCPGDMKWCDYQSRCVTSNACCIGADCKGSSDCIASGESINVCLKEGSEEVCKRVQSGRTENALVREQNHIIGFVKRLSDDSLYLKVNFQDVTAKINVPIDLPSGPRLTVERYFTYGGQCE